MLNKTVILAFPHADEQKAICQLLQDAGMTVHVTDSGYEVIRMMEDYPCDVLLVDVQLVDMSAWILLSKLREIYTPLPMPMVVMVNEHMPMPLDARVTLMVRPVAENVLKQTLKNA